MISTMRRLKLMRVQRELRRAHWRAKLQLDSVVSGTTKKIKSRRSSRLTRER
jgi:hypothetical protein